MKKIITAIIVSLSVTTHAINLRPSYLIYRLVDQLDPLDVMIPAVCCTGLVCATDRCCHAQATNLCRRCCGQVGERCCAGLLLASRDMRIKCGECPRLWVEHNRRVALMERKMERDS